MTEDEKTAIKAFIDSLHPVSSDAWKARALVAEQTIFNLKNTINVGKGLQCSISNLHDNVAKLVFRWNESENLRNQLTEIDSKLNDVPNLGCTPLDKINTLMMWYKNIDSRNTKMNKEITDLKKYFLNLSEEFVKKSL